jgi:hypothetical protein
MDLGREKLLWTEEVWKLIDEAVHAEAHRTKSPPDSYRSTGRSVQYLSCPPTGSTRTR